jgi:hypothetical protein
MARNRRIHRIDDAEQRIVVQRQDRVVELNGGGLLDSAKLKAPIQIPLSVNFTDAATLVLFAHTRYPRPFSLRWNSFHSP